MSNVIYSGSRNRKIAVTIVWKCYFPRWRPIWPSTLSYGLRYSHFCALVAILAAILESNIPTLLRLRYFDSLTPKILNSTLHLPLYLIYELRYTYFCFDGHIGRLLENLNFHTIAATRKRFLEPENINFDA